MLTKEFIESKGYEVIAKLAKPEFGFNLSTEEALPIANEIARSISVEAAKENTKYDGFKNFATSVMYGSILADENAIVFSKAVYESVKKLTPEECRDPEIATTNLIREGLRNNLQTAIDKILLPSNLSCLKDVLIYHLLEVDWQSIAVAMATKVMNDQEVS